jgi:glycosyltransferase involved in cell wall biosynthesis
MINIAYVIDTIETPNAGTEKQLLMLIENLDKNRFSPHLIVLRDSVWLKQCKLPCPVCNISLASFACAHLVKAFLTFRRYCKKNEIGIMQTFFVDANIFGTLAAYLSRVEVIISSRRNYGLGYWHNNYWLIIMKALRHITSCYIANSRITADYTAMSENVSKDKIHVIYNGLYLGRFKQITHDERKSYRSSIGIKPNHILIGTVANLRSIKNLSLFIRVAAISHKKYPHTRFIIVGDGPEKGNLEKMIHDYCVQDVVILAGQHDDILPFLSSMDIGVLCSKSESLSNSVIEYMAAGLPCVVSEVGGNSEAIGYEYGFSFKSGDEKDFFAKLEPLIVDEQLCLNTGQAAKTYAFSKYDHKEIVKQYQEIYCKYYQTIA